MRRLLMALAALCALCAAAAETRFTLPSWFPAPEGYSIQEPRYSGYDLYGGLVLGHANKLPKNSGGYTPVAGRVWSFQIVPPGHPKDQKAACLAIFASAIRAKLEAQGFHKAGDPCCGGTVLAKGPDESALYAQNGSCSVTLVETAPNSFKVDLHPPGDKQERFGVKDDIPYLAPLANSVRRGGRNDVKNYINVHAPDCKAPSGPFGTRYSEREYEGPQGLSAYAVQEAYKTAFHEAGWDPVCQLAGTGAIDAHYTRDGRDIWAQVRTSGFSHSSPDYQLSVADAGSGLREDLKKSCKAALYGVNFDFDKATLRPDAEPALNQVLALMKDEPKLAVEIGGHTDNVGKPDYNMKLSDERAASVVKWLEAHGIAASRLSSHGYGDTQPLVKNDSDEHRARNRRVELKRKGCR
jgi:outer membrane protein OmpA-like peptidoglycan-associated protein